MCQSILVGFRVSEQCTWEPHSTFMDVTSEEMDARQATAKKGRKIHRNIKLPEAYHAVFSPFGVALLSFLTYATAYLIHTSETQISTVFIDLFIGFSNRTGATESCAQSNGLPYRSHQQYTSLSKSKPSWLHGARRGRLRGVSQGCKKSLSRPDPNVSGDRRHTKSRIARQHHTLKLVRKSGGRKKPHLAQVPQQQSIVMTRFNFRHNRRMEKRSPGLSLPSCFPLCHGLLINDNHVGHKPVSSSLSSLLGSLSSPLSSFPVVGVPLTNLFSTLSTSSLTSPGATIAGLLGTLTGATQSAPVLGDLLKLLPLSAVLKVSPIENFKSTLSGIFVAVPLVGGTLGGLPTAASGIASSLSFSLADMRAVTSITTQSVFMSLIIMTTAI
ncbi:uncharacterized protein VP01_3698g2 [Puccinia sorghi]|uniref:Uncharacterized protein n=1 Tax=Puccinia sorghi TaxID=27349 RepID=A0A0L6UW53_9BASI|nr:uncharacterized protein VP01_3698g2 [Puccinia sorghi]